MKTLKIISILILAVIAFSCSKSIVSKSVTVNPERVAIVYTSDNANSITAAACAAIKYEHNTSINIDNMTEANQLTAIQAIVDSVHRVLLCVDTATAWATNKITGAQYDSLVERIYKVETYGAAPDLIPEYYQATATANLAEVVWADLYSTYTVPLIVEYLGDNIFSSLVSRTKKVNTDSTAVDSTNTLVADAYNGDWIYIYDGQGIGQSRLIYDNTTSAIYVSPDWDANPDETSLFKIKKVEEVDELFYDMYAALYIFSNLRDLTDQQVINNWHKLVDMNYNINDGNVRRTPYQDIDYLRNTVLVGGKIIYDYGVHQADDY